MREVTLPKPGREPILDALLNDSIWLRHDILSNEFIALVNQKAFKLGENLLIDSHILEFGLTYDAVLVELLLAVDSHLFIILKHILHYISKWVLGIYWPIIHSQVHVLREIYIGVFDQGDKTVM